MIMKQSIKTDIICIEKIIKYVKGIKECFEHFNINSDSDLQDTFLAKLAITQLITNIYETKKHIQDVTLQKIPNLNSINLQAARHIASHDYESVSFDIIYRRCLQLTSEKVYNELESFIEGDYDENN